LQGDWSLRKLQIHVSGDHPSNPALSDFREREGVFRSSEPRRHARRARSFPVLSHAILAPVLTLLFTLPLRAAESATVTFSLDFPGSEPDHYSISVRSDGHTTYESSGKIATDSDDREVYQTEFTISEATRAQIFDLAARAHYFSGKIDSGNKKLAFTGNKKLTYADGQKTTTADYNFSPQPTVQQLTSLFQTISATLEFGRRLTREHQYQKLALDEELKQMETQAAGRELSELQAVKPILQAIYDDPSVMNVVRARAQRIMEMGNGGPTGH
jgi:hypothetical protein